MPTPESTDQNDLERRGSEALIRIGVALILVAWCFQIVRPFIQPIVWGMIIAVASHSAYQWIENRLGGRSRLAATLYIVLAFMLLMAPAFMLAGTFVDGVQIVAEDLHDGKMSIPPPPETVATWPIIGGHLHELWGEASNNLTAALSKIGPELQTIGSWLVSKAAGVGLALLQFMASIIVAGVLLVHASGGARLARSVATRLVGDRGQEFADLAGSTVRSVARGVLGVALIQSILAGIGFLVLGLPAAGLWALIVFFCAVIQLPVFLVLAPIVLYVFATSSTTAAVLFTIWCVLVGGSDNVLKPILLGRGAPVPMLVIFLGVIGGFILNGIIGLFTGAIVLALGYKLFVAWLEREAAEVAMD